MREETIALSNIGVIITSEGGR